MTLYYLIETWDFWYHKAYPVVLIFHKGSWVILPLEMWKDIGQGICWILNSCRTFSWFSGKGSTAHPTPPPVSFLHRYNRILKTGWFKQQMPTVLLKASDGFSLSGLKTATFHPCPHTVYLLCAHISSKNIS